MLEVEGVLHLDQERRGRELFLCAAATTDHINISRFDSFLSGHFWGEYTCQGPPSLEENDGRYGKEMAPAYGLSSA